MAQASRLLGGRVCACTTACDTARLCCQTWLERGGDISLSSTRLRVIDEGSSSPVSACEVYFKATSSNGVGNFFFVLQALTLVCWYWQRVCASVHTSPKAIMDAQRDDEDAHLFSSPEVQSPPNKVHRVGPETDGATQN